jgi:predicted O-linked N-acetylglucosamine transferase (SPINDLY family)
MGDDEAAQIISGDDVKILIDLNGYTHGARTGLLALRPAPIIVNWLGYPGTTGSPAHHYIIADEFIIPFGSEMYYSETVCRLPCYQPNDRKRQSSQQAPSRREAGLPEGAMVYCCFNGAHKLTPFTWHRWMAILRQVPDSILWLLEGVQTTNETLVRLAAEHGISSNRLVFAGRRSNAEHLARYQLADLFLDTTPYGAHTTASDALWMGVPIVTLAGRNFASRVCGSLLRAAGIGELVCSTGEQYIALAVELGRNPLKLAELRQKLRAQRDGCVLFDTPQLVSRLEALYQEMWRAARTGQLPRPELSNVQLYGEVGIALDRDDRELLTADYCARYRSELTDRNKPWGACSTL